jgi:hypothetical protein
MTRQELRELCARRNLDARTVERLLGCSRSQREKLTGHGHDSRTLRHGEAVLFRLLDAHPELVEEAVSGSYVPGVAGPAALDFLGQQRIVALLAMVGGDPGTLVEYLEHVPALADRAVIAPLVDKGYVAIDSGVPRVTELGHAVFRVRAVVEFWKAVGCELVEHVRPLTPAEWDKLKRAA